MPKQTAVPQPTPYPPQPLPTRRRLCDLLPDERPLHRLDHHGPTTLTTSELLALTLASPDAPGLADELLHQFGSLHQLARATSSQLRQTHGIGAAQAGRLVAVMELCRRLQAPPFTDLPRITSPADAAALLTPRLAHLQQEELHVLLLDTRNRVLKTIPLYRGSLNSSVIRVGELFRAAIETAAAAVIIAHNHPSGDPAPSPEDIHVTRQVVEAGKLLDVSVLDHLIIANQGFVSLKERGLGFE